jgi:hypothetical protein
MGISPKKSCSTRVVGVMEGRGGRDELYTRKAGQGHLPSPNKISGLPGKASRFYKQY